MKIIDTYINLSIDCSDMNNLSVLDNGESRLVLKNTSMDGVFPSILRIDFSQKHTQFLLKGNLDQQIIFINGIYQVLKKNEIPFINIKVLKAIAKNKKQVLDIKNIRDDIYSDFETNNLSSLKEKYLDSCTKEEIINLKKVIEIRDCLKLKSQLKSQEIQKLKHEKKILQLKKRIHQ